MPTLFSRYQIGEPVWLEVSSEDEPDMRVKAHVRYVIFTNGKVRYGVTLLYLNTTLHNVDSILVTNRPDGGLVEFEFDNLS